MIENQEVIISRLAGADTISNRAIAFAKERGLTIEKCQWDIGKDISHAQAHRLDLFTDSKTVRLYFPDIELIKSDDIGRKQRIETRLKSAIAQLIPHVPVATYALLK